jgi:hypothetical protein
MGYFVGRMEGPACGAWPWVGRLVCKQDPSRACTSVAHSVHTRGVPAMLLAPVGRCNRVQVL